MSELEIGGDIEHIRLRVAIHGAVQGVGFRPFVYRLATEIGLPGWVNNSSQGVFIEVEGPRNDLDTFLQRVREERPPLAVIQSMEHSFLDAVDFKSFEIRESDGDASRTTHILPDIATCPDCLKEVFDPDDRRYLYPFTNCTNCGPRFSIIEDLPYDRPKTTMKIFDMCDDCRAEYEDPTNRRFHAQPNACPVCGPRLELWNARGKVLASHHKVILEAVKAIRNGQTVAVKGIGGFHLMVDARNEEAVQQLRERKNRDEKPFAVMYPTMAAIKCDCEVTPLEETLLSSPESPIVLLRRKNNPKLLPARENGWVAPHNPHLGVMLPYTPLHHILLKKLAVPVVATSGNLSEEPICIDEKDALVRLSTLADIFLVHNRPIARHVDDSIVRVMADREIVLRRARGYAPLPIPIKDKMAPTLAVGGHLKNSVALVIEDQVFVSQHIGDLETTAALDAFKEVITDFTRLYDTQPHYVGCDLHPDYLSTKHAQTELTATSMVQHHHAHIVSCMAENELDGPVLGVAWDGTGYGLDGTIWGGEFLVATRTSFVRAAHLRTFMLPGGEKAVKEPRRSALGLLYEMFGTEAFEKDELAPLQAFSARELNILQSMLLDQLNAPVTSSAGRLFDTVAAILDLKQILRYEGQAAMELEFLAFQSQTDHSYPYLIKEGRPSTQDPLVIDWAPIINHILRDVREEKEPVLISAMFHNTLSQIIVEIAQRLEAPQVVLSGGCFQNRYLTERAIRELRKEGITPYWHQRVPPNDGGIALGQAVAAAVPEDETVDYEKLGM